MGDLSVRAVELEEKIETAAKALETFKAPPMIAPLVGDIGDSLRIVGDTLRDSSQLISDLAQRVESMEEE